MELLVVNIFLSCILLARTAQSDDSTDVPVNLVCPETKGIVLASTLVSGCKVHYICEDGKYKLFSKLYKCSESQILTGKTRNCQENTQCPGLESIKQSATPDIADESIRTTAEPPNHEPKKRDLDNKSPIETTLHFFKCLFEVGDVDQFTKKCMDSEIFLRQTFIEMDEPKVMEYVSQLLNASEVAGSNEVTTVEEALKALISYLAPQCEVQCKNRVERRVGSVLESTTMETVITGNEYRLLSSKETKGLPQNNGTGFTEHLLVPIVRDIVHDQDAMANITRMFRIVVDAVVPLAKEILESSKEDYRPEQKSVLKIRRKTYDAMWDKIDSEAYPIFRQLLEVKLSPIMALWSRNVKVLIKAFYEMENRTEHRYMDLFYKGVGLFVKYSLMHNNSTRDYIQTYSLLEVQKDIQSVLSILTEESKESIGKNLNILLEATGITKEAVTEFFVDIAAKYPGIIASTIENFLFVFYFFL